MKWRNILNSGNALQIHSDTSNGRLKYIRYLCKTANKARCLPGTLEVLRADGVQIVILDSPEIYSEYAPYSYIEDMKEFIDQVSQLNHVA